MWKLCLYHTLQTGMSPALRVRFIAFTESPITQYNKTRFIFVLRHEHSVLRIKKIYPFVTQRSSTRELKTSFSSTILALIAD